MTPWHQQVPASAVVALLPRLGKDGRPPAELPIAPRPPRAVRLIVVLLATLGGLGSLGLVVLLWTTDTPGIVFDVIFTVMGALLGLGLPAMVGGWHARAGQEEIAKQQWRASPPSAPASGTVVDREVILMSESGSVGKIHLLVRSGGEQIAATWRASGGTTMLQTQVPGIGSPVRVWRSNAGPVLVEVADPSVVTSQDAR